jgi:CO/xanthine dehydrogenase Mo-binding subunit
VKWIESRIDNISTTGFARDYHGVGELAADKDGRIKGLRFGALADHGAFNSHVSATKFPRACFPSAPARTRSRTPIAAWTRCSPTRRRAAWPIGAPCA